MTMGRSSSKGLSSKTRWAVLKVLAEPDTSLTMEQIVTQTGVRGDAVHAALRRPVPPGG